MFQEIMYLYCAMHNFPLNVVSWTVQISQSSDCIHVFAKDTWILNMRKDFVLQETNLRFTTWTWHSIAFLPPAVEWILLFFLVPFCMVIWEFEFPLNTISYSVFSSAISMQCWQIIIGTLQDHVTSLVMQFLILCPLYWLF